MNDPTSKKRECSFNPGQVIVGSWHGNSYQMIRLLGKGAIGKVYLAKNQHGLVAVKVAHESMSVSSEVNVLRRISKAQGLSLGPCFLDMDDVKMINGTSSFYVMEYIDGVAFLPFLKNKGIEWLGILLSQLLGDLYHLHQAGYIFGDLKPENLIVTENPCKLRWIDVGGITKTGRSIKEYTEFFDRGYWGLGDRRADPAYDLFSVAMLMVNRGYHARFQRIGDNGIAQLSAKLKESSILRPYVPVIQRGIQSKYHNALDMKKDIVDVLKNQSNNVKKTKTRVNKRKYSVNLQKPLKKTNGFFQKERMKYKGVIETILFASFIMIFYILYLVG